MTALIRHLRLLWLEHWAEAATDEAELSDRRADDHRASAAALHIKAADLRRRARMLRLGA